MKTLLSTLFLLSASALLAGTGISTPASAPVSDDVLLSAIAAVETGNNPSRLGHYGERTQLQILPETWREFSRLPHSRAAANPAETERVARAYLQVIRHRLEARGLPQTPYYIAAGWNAGPGFRRLSPGTVSYAKRVANVVEMELALEARAAVAAAAEAARAPAPTVATAQPVRVHPTRPLIPLGAVLKPNAPVIALDTPAQVNFMAQPVESAGPRLYLMASN
jgi:hypothetical protein